MGPPRLAAVLTAVLLAASAAQGQDDAEQLKKVLKKELAAPAKGDLLKEDAAAIKKKLLLNCKKTGDCKPTLLDKKKSGKKNALEAAPETDSVDGPDGGIVVGDDASAPAPPPERVEAVRQEAVVRRGRALENAAGAAESLRRSLAPAEDEPAEGGQAPERSSPGGTASDLALAERTGYAAAFRAVGLKVGVGPAGEPAIQRLDGRPASEAEVGRLRAVLRAEPAALARRPDFFAVLPRERFAELKQDFTSRPELRRTAFKDIGLTEQGRDFTWSASCSGVSGDCNPYAGEASYRKGQDVPPEVLDDVWEAARALDDEEEEDDEDWGEYTEEDRRLAEAEDLAAAKLASGGGRLAGLKSLLGRLGSAVRGLGEAAGFDSGPAVPPPPAASVPVGGGAPGDAPSGEPALEGARPSASAPRSGPPPAPGGRRAAARRGGLYALAALAAAALVARGLKRSVSPSSGR